MHNVHCTFEAKELHVEALLVRFNIGSILINDKGMEVLLFINNN